LRELAIAETDQLTGARTRAAGLRHIDHEIARAHRTRGLLVAAYVDVVGLRWMRVSTGRSELVSLMSFTVVGVLGSGGQRDDSDNGSL
jgi:hypothetical protein